MYIRDKCPNCLKTTGIYLLATTNEWKYNCSECDARFNDEGEVLGEGIEYPTYYCDTEFFHPLCLEQQCVYCDAMRPWPLVRLEDTPISKIYWYYFTHRDLWCPSFVVARHYYTLIFTPITLRQIKIAGDWRGVYGSVGR